MSENSYESVRSFLNNHSTNNRRIISLRSLLNEENNVQALTKRECLNKIEVDARYKVNGLNIRKNNLEYCMRTKEYENLDSGEVLVEIEFYSKMGHNIVIPFFFESNFELNQWKSSHRHAFCAHFEWNDADYEIQVDAHINSLKVNFMLTYKKQDISYRSLELSLREDSDWESSARDWLSDLGMSPESFKLIKKTGQREGLC